MTSKKVILGAASVLALTAATATANASIQRQEAQQPDPRQQQAVDIKSDDLFDLVMRVQGSLEPDYVESALKDMFGELTQAQADGLPELLTNLARLGASAETIARAQEILIGLVSSKLDGAIAQGVVEDLKRGPATVKLAQNRRGRDPATTGQVGGGGGGAPGGGGYQ